MHVILNGEPLEEVDCFKYLGSQVAADVGCERDVVHRMNEGYGAFWGALKSVLSNRRSRMKAKKCQYETVIVPTALYGAEAWGMRSAERRKVNSMARSLPVENLLPQNMGSMINYLQQCTEAAQWGTPGCSQPQSATNNGVKDGRSNCGRTPHPHGHYPLSATCIV